MTPPGAVVIGLDCPTGLQTTRILAQHGIPVIGLARDPTHPCCRTRVPRRIVAAEADGSALADTLVRVGQELDHRPVLFPCTDLSVLTASRYRTRLAAWYYLALPQPDVVETLLDKSRFYPWAAGQGFPVPVTRVLQRPEDVEQASRDLRFPCVLKPAVKTVAWDRHVAFKALRVASPTELRSTYHQLARWSDALLVQERVEGGDVCHFTCNCYFDRRGDPLVTFTSRKLRQWPPEGGQGCLSEEYQDEVVRELTVRLFQAASHRGLGYLEIKRDARTGAYHVLEANVGRPTGRSAAAEAAGVELLYTQYCDVLGRALPANREQQFRGVKWVYFRRDLCAALCLWRRGELSVVGWWRSLSGPKAWALFSWTDPAPFWLDLWRAALRLPDLARQWCGRGTRSLLRRATRLVRGTHPATRPADGSS